jgi:hypothetical protein
MRFEVLMAVKMPVVAFWVLTPCKFVVGYHHTEQVHLVSKHRVQPPRENNCWKHCLKLNKEMFVLDGAWLLCSLICHQLCSRYTTTPPATILCPSLCCLSSSTYTNVKVLPHYGRGSAAYSWSEAWPSQLKTSSANSHPGPSMWWGG